MTLDRRLMAEWLGTVSLLATVVGSGIMAQRLAGGSVAVAPLGKAIPTGASLVVLISVFGPISAAHCNPTVTLSCALRRKIVPHEAVPHVGAQSFGGIVWVLAAHVMFANPAVTIARGFSNTFAGNAPANAAAFILMQLIAANLATWFLCRTLEEPKVG